MSLSLQRLQMSADRMFDHTFKEAAQAVTVYVLASDSGHNAATGTRDQTHTPYARTALPTTPGATDRPAGERPRFVREQWLKVRVKEGGNTLPTPAKSAVPSQPSTDYVMIGADRWSIQDARVGTGDVFLSLHLSQP